MRPYIFATLLATTIPLTALAQQPFERFGVKVKVVTLSDGRYPEFFENDSLRRIGSVVYNTRLHRVAYLLPADSLAGRTRPEVTSRWLSVDPLAQKYVGISPYTYVLNNPMIFIDPDGRKVAFAGKASLAAYELFKANAQKSEKAMAMIRRIEDSDVLYMINVGENNINDPFGENVSNFKGGDTNPNVAAGRIDISIGPDLDMTQAILADELRQAYQFDAGEIGFAVSEENGTMILNYDLADEEESKVDGTEAIIRDGKTLNKTPTKDGRTPAKFRKKYSSTGYMQAYENKTLTDEVRQQFANSPGYKGNFTGSTEPGKKTKVDDASINGIPSGFRPVYAVPSETGENRSKLMIGDKKSPQ